MRTAFLLDAHISPRVARLLKRAGIDARAVGGSPMMNAPDEELLDLALRDRRLFVTYDTATVPAAVAERVRQNLEIPGVVYVSSATIPSSDLAGLARTLRRLAENVETGAVDPSGGLFLERAD
jgi:predicted nuclease of predicted toxin-antitoxin system